MLHSPFSVHLCFPLGTVKPCFVSERVVRADPQTVRFDKVLNFWATIIIQTLYILSQKSGQQSTLLESLSKHFCIHYFYVAKDSKELIIIQLSTTPRNSMQMNCDPCCLFIRFENFGGQNENPCTETSIKSPSSLIMFLSVSSESSTMQDILF